MLFNCENGALNRIKDREKKQSSYISLMSDGFNCTRLYLIKYFLKKFFLPILHVVYRIDFVKMTENKIYIFVSKQLMYIFKKGMQIVQIQ